MQYKGFIFMRLFTGRDLIQPESGKFFLCSLFIALMGGEDSAK